MVVTGAIPLCQRHAVLYPIVLHALLLSSMVIHRTMRRALLYAPYSEQEAREKTAAAAHVLSELSHARSTLSLHRVCLTP